MARIVVIDDEQRLLQTLARFLEQQGHEVVTATEFAAVSEQLYPGRFEVLITDIVMPGFDGMQVLREVVETRGCQEPVILITGEPNLETAAEAVRRGAFDYISASPSPRTSCSRQPLAGCATSNCCASATGHFRAKWRCSATWRGSASRLRF